MNVVKNITWEELQDLYVGLTLVKEIPSFNIKWSYAVAKNHRCIKPELEDFESTIRPLISISNKEKAIYYKYAEKRDGKLVDALDPTSTWELADDFSINDPRILINENVKGDVQKEVEKLLESSKEIIENKDKVLSNYLKSQKDCIPDELQSKIMKVPLDSILDQE